MIGNCVKRKGIKFLVVKSKECPLKIDNCIGCNNLGSWEGTHDPKSIIINCTYLKGVK